ncbi:MAG: LptA/OstA family protein, partial [Bryobacteraceae bacterium]
MRCARAVFDPAEATLRSEDEVEFTMGLRPEGQQGRLVSIRASGVTFDNRSGRVTTDREVRFQLEDGEGKAVGATYDPGIRELHLHAQVELLWRGRHPGGRPMRLEAGELIYKEKDSLILLFPWAKLYRDNAWLEAAHTIVHLRDGSIREIEAQAARGQERRPGTLVHFSADHVWLTLTSTGELEKVTAEGNARAASRGESAHTTAAAARLDLEFSATHESSSLRGVLATGRASLLSEPVPRPGVKPAETRRLTSQVIRIEMRPGGKEVEQVRTETPGSLEFIPNQPRQQHRWLQAERLWVNYGEANHVRSVRAVNVATRSEPDPTARASKTAPPAPVETWSRDLHAELDPQTGELRRIEQWNDFRYREGEREARAERAVLDQPAGRLLLEGAARAWDREGVVAADRLEMDRSSGDLIAAGHVRCTHRPEHRPRAGSLLCNQENLEAQAERMQTFERRTKIVYEGNVRLWQGANRLQARRVEIDRARRLLYAEGDVLTQFVDRRQPSGPPVFVVVRAARLTYSDEERLAHYSGGVKLQRGELEVEAPELRTWFKQEGQESALDRAVATGGVRLVHRSAGRVRQATCEVAEYYAAEDRAILSGGQPTLTDDRRGRARGQRLAWRLRDD